jgi:CubicO group peptidase (beta-lactamase class C family)
MKRFLKTLCFIALVVFPSFSAERAPLSSVIPVLDAYIEQSMAAEGIPGAVIVIVKDGKIVHIKGFGVKTLGQPARVDEHTPFVLASLTKNFTATLVARLVDQGKLNWNDQVVKFLPEFQLGDPKITRELTIEDLLSHRCGLKGYAGDSFIDSGWTASEIIPAMKFMPVTGKFRETYDYQNIMVGLTGKIIEKVTGKSLPQLYREELLQPAGLTESRLEVRQEQNLTLWQKISAFFSRLFHQSKPQPSLHDRFQGQIRHLSKGNPAIFTFPASSGMISTGHDMGQWLIFQLNKAKIDGKTIVSSLNLNQMRTPHITNIPLGNGYHFPPNRTTHVDYGMGWFIHDYAGASPLLSHMGGMAGSRTVMLIMPEDNIGIAILSNLGGMRVSFFPEAIRNKFLDLYLNVPDEVDWATKMREEMQSYRDRNEKQRRLYAISHPAPARDLNFYTGTYENSLYGRVNITRQDQKLLLTYRHREPVNLQHWNGNTFQFNGSDLSFGFSGTDRGEILFANEGPKSPSLMITLFHEGPDTLFHRVP